MAGERLFLTFSPREECKRWATRIGMEELSEGERETAYARALQLLVQQTDALRSDYGLILTSDFEGHVDIASASDIRKVSLPSRLSTFFETTWPEEGNEMLGQSDVFPRRVGRWNVSIEGPKPVCDFLYTLQCIVPGLLLVGIDEIDDSIEECAKRALPLAGWIEEHRESLETVLGEAARCRDLWIAAGRYIKSYETKLLGYYRDDEELDDEDDAREWDDYEAEEWELDDPQTPDDETRIMFSEWEKAKGPVDTCDPDCEYCASTKAGSGRNFHSGLTSLKDLSRSVRSTRCCPEIHPVE
ncbi:hypothetical protein BV25DRAFT_1986314 [Artomyces pyxidatus]|uniref:Uncharacterized protein n=1 Tax=Artomyces pyxidatus TaxID=48021 RepID=A0ACB8TK27_9AGAM|nr:hypothetical protein BV25DRAFT_1986314 [Artomyces pyxidatus]